MEVQQVDRVLDKLIQVESEAKSLDSLVKEKSVVLEQSLSKHEELTKLIELDSAATEVVKVLFDKTSETGFRFLEQLATKGLQTVFADENYSFKIETGSRGNEKTANFYIVDNGVRYSITECGGGPQVLISFIFRVYYILRTKKRRLIAMDETFASLSPHYLEPLLSFMEMLIEQLQFKFFLCSHSPYLEGRVDRFYDVYKGKLRQGSGSSKTNL